MKKAIVLLNMGGPNNLHEVELFLKNMFNDKHILSIPSARIRKFVAGIITTLRVEKAQEVYRQLGNKSPLVGYTNELIKAIDRSVGDAFVTVAAMRYTPPFASDAIDALMQEDIEHLYLVPLYPQHSTTTTASSVEDFIEMMDKKHFDVTTTVISSFYGNEYLNRGIVESIQQAVQGEGVGEIDLIFSAHGLPESVIKKGDLYQMHVEEHVDILSKKLQESGLQFHSVSLAYQSKVGPMKWIEPSLEQALEAKKANKKALIYPIAFMIDNSETEFELHIEYEEVAKELGYEYYKVVPCLNDHPMLVNTILDLIGYEK